MHGAGVRKYEPIPKVFNAKLLVETGYAVVRGAYLLCRHFNGNAVYRVHNVNKRMKIHHNIVVQLQMEVMFYGLIQQFNPAERNGGIELSVPVPGYVHEHVAHEGGEL